MLIEEGFEWVEMIGGLRKLHQREHEKVNWIFALTNTTYNLVRTRIRAGVCA